MAENEDIEMHDSESDMDTDELTQNKYENCVFVDIQGFKTSHNRFMCKEFCLVDGKFIYHALVKSPSKFNRMSKDHQRQANWLIHNHHRIDNDCGDVHINDLKETILPKILGNIIIVKGAQKIDWLKQIFPDCQGLVGYENAEDLEDFDWSSRPSQSFDLCNYHKEAHGELGGPCALTTALMLAYMNKV